MKSRIYYILIVIFLSVAALNLTLNNNSINSSLHLSKVKLNNNNVLYIKINVISFYYIDSVTVQQIGENNETTFKITSKTKKASLDYFIKKDEIVGDKFVVKIFSNGKFEKYIQKVVMN